jgi:hypothetical protein
MKDQKGHAGVMRQVAREEREAALRWTGSRPLPIKRSYSRGRDATRLKQARERD